jgi:hypothetical protein
MEFRSSIAKGASTVAIIAAISAFGACDDATPGPVMNPGGNVIPPRPSPVVEEPRAVSGFSGVVLDGVGHVFVQQGGMESLRIRTEELILPYLTTEVRGGQLVLGFRPGTSYRGEASAIEFHLTVANLERVELRGAGMIRASNIDTNRLSLALTGAGTIDLPDLTASRVDATQTGVGTTTVSGAVQQQSVVLGGVGDYDARHLDSVEAEITILAAGSATVRVSDRLDARIDGMGSVYYIGDPVVQRTGHGSGSVVPAGG